jgi:hypothetical protein
MESTSSRSLGLAASRGFLAGALATVAMSGVMILAKKGGLMGRMPPRLITRRVFRELGIWSVTMPPVEKVATAVAHVAFGGVAGAAFEIARTRGFDGEASARRTVPAGILYASAIWVASYAGWVPRLGILPRPTRDRPGRQPSLVIAHWVYGAVLGRLLSRFPERSGGSSRASKRYFQRKLTPGESLA